MTPTTDTPGSLRDELYWRKSLRLTGTLLVLWFVMTFGFGFWAGDLNFSLFGWPVSFWVAAQGALLAYCGIVWYYARVMNRLDDAYGAPDAD